MIPVSRPKLSQLEIDYVTDAVKSGWVSSLGPYIDAFEQKFAEFCGTKFAVSVSNGTVGIHLALKVLNIGEGDEVIVPDLTFIATANTVVTAGAKPVFVDVCRNTYCIDPDQLEKSITPKTKAIIPVHLYGHPANMKAIQRIADKHGLIVIEDAAEAHGASIDGVRVGAFGTFGVFSFYGNKIITSGEGGMLTTNDAELYQRAKFLRDHAMSKEKRYWHTETGFNYRMTNLQAALGLAQLEQVNSFIEERDRILSLYRDHLKGSGVELNPAVSCRPVNWMVCVVLEEFDRSRRDKIISRLKENGVDARPFFFPMSMMPMFEQVNNPVSYKLSECGLNLPTFVGITNDEIVKASRELVLAIEATGK